MVLLYCFYNFSFPKLFMGHVSVLFARYWIVGNLHQDSYELLGMIILCSSCFFFFFKLFLLGCVCRSK